MDKHIIDPNKLAEVFNTKWYHPKIVGGYQQSETAEAAHLYNICIEPSGTKLAIDISNERDLIVRPGVSYVDDNSKIKFKTITNVYYFKYTHVFVAESVLENSFSELIVFGDGEFDLTVNIPLNLYSNSFAKRQEEKEKIYKK